MKPEENIWDTLKDSSCGLSDMRIVLLGNRNSGKSSAGNTILNREEFELKRTAQCVKRQGEVAGRHITVVEAPGWSIKKSVEESTELLKQETVLSVSLCPPGPHAVLLIIRVDSILKENYRSALEGYLKLLTDTVWSHTIVLFTCGDCLGDIPIEQHIESEGKELQWLVEKCGNRYHVLNNKNRSDDTQVTELLEKIEKMVAANNGSHFQIDRKILQEVEEKRRAEEERVNERMIKVRKQRESIKSVSEIGDSLHLSEMRIVLLGCRYSGKSSAGNTILNREEFELKRTAQCVTRQGEVAGRHITVVEAPGWWSNKSVERSAELLKQEIVLSVSLCPPGPHAVLLVIRLDCAFDINYRSILEGYLKLLTDTVWSHTIVLFTFGDCLGDTPIEQHIESEGKELQGLAEKCGNRYHVLNNKNRSDDTQVTELVEKIEEMVAANSGRHFEMDRKILQEVEEKRRAEEERVNERMIKVHKMKKSIRSQMGDSHPLSELRIVLLGNKYAGKSSAGNTILSKEEFEFKATAQCVKRQGEVAGRHITVVEAPGWWKNEPAEKSTELLKQEIVLSVSLCPPGPHAVLLILSVDSVFKENYRSVLEGYLNLLTDTVWSHTIVLFTFGDCLGDTPIEQHIESEGKELQWLVEKCGNRYHVLNNKNRSDDTQVTELVEKIEEMVAANSGRHFEMDRRILQEGEEMGRAGEKTIKNIRSQGVSRERNSSSMGSLFISKIRPSSSLFTNSSSSSEFGAQEGFHGSMDFPPGMSREKNSEMGGWLRSQIRASSTLSISSSSSGFGSQESFHGSMEFPPGVSEEQKTHTQSLQSILSANSTGYGSLQTIQESVQHPKLLKTTTSDQCFKTFLFISDADHHLLELRIVLLGSRYAGKSSAGNTILNREEFELKRTAQCVKRQGEVAGRHITVVEAPGWWNSTPVEESTELLKQEIVLSVSLCPPGPHCLLLVICVAIEFTERHREILEGYIELLGETVWSHTIVLFTFGDYLGDTPIERHIESEGKTFQWLVEKCGNRYHVLNNKNRSDEGTELLKEIEEMVAANATGRNFDRRISRMEEIQRAEEERIIKQRMKRQKSKHIRSWIRTSDDFGNISLEQHIPNEKLQWLIRKYRNRYNEEHDMTRSDDTLVTELLKKIETMVAANSGQHFEMDRKILQEVEEKRRAEEDRVKERMIKVQKQREDVRSRMCDSHHLSELRIVLLGYIYAGKSSAGNTILNREEFELKRTAQCMKRQGEVAGRHITVVEAPGWFWNECVEESTELLKQEIVLSVSLCPPGPHAVLLIIRVDTASKENNIKTFNGYLELLTEKIWSHTIVLFTFGDWLGDTPIEQHIESEGKDLQWLLEKCGNRYHVLNSENRNDGTLELLEKIEEMVAANNGHHFEMDRKILQEVEEKRRAEDERAKERMIKVQKKKENLRSHMPGSHRLSELRIVLLGNRNAGKSSAGNTILNREEFELKRTAQCVKRQGEVAGRHITVVEAPGWWANNPIEESTELLKQEIVLSVSLCPPGPQALLLITRMDTIFNKNGREVIEGYLNLLTGTVWSHTIVLFTCGDCLGDTAIEQHIESEGKELQCLVEKCGNRYHVLNNENRSDDTQVTELLEKIEEMVAANNGCCFEMDRTVLLDLVNKRHEVKKGAKERMMKVQNEREDHRSHICDSHHLSEMRIVLLGYKYSGKTSAGNTILGRKMSEVKRTAQCVKRQGEVAGRHITVVEAPGWWKDIEVEESTELLKQDIMLGVTLCPLEPHAILLTIRLDIIFKENERTVLEQHLKNLTERFWRHTIVLFTFGDWLGDTPIEQHIESEGKELQWLVEKCGNRYHVLNNVNRSDNTQVTELLEKIEEMVAASSGCHFGINQNNLQKVEEKESGDITSHILEALPEDSESSSLVEWYSLAQYTFIEDVKNQFMEFTSIKTSSKCQLTPGRKYRPLCDPYVPQPKIEVFERDHGPNYHPAFVVHTEAESITVSLLDEDGMEVWEPHNCFLTGSCVSAVEISNIVTALTQASLTLIQIFYFNISAAEFVDKYRAELIQRVPFVMEIADCLKSENMITNEMYNNIQTTKTSQEQMRILYATALDPGGAAVKVEFYKILKKKQPCLVDELEPEQARHRGLLS
ncbi:hypothetical protein NFI96_027876 [Prochilodus magdalenae]|nr:hypothetical protein NFI96_027876 [Prochilodus magdalenae]